jgi:Holliday junction resolvase RusA-like endonuclease
MSDEIILEGTLYTAPKTKARPRLTRGGKAYNPESTRVAQRKQALLFKGFSFKSSKKFPLSKKLPLEVHLTFYHKGGKEVSPKLTVPDIDNLCKLTLDAITDAGVWKTDSQITKLVTEDLWAGPEGKPRIEFLIKEHKVFINLNEDENDTKD